MKEVTFSFDGKTVEAAEGSLVIDAAKPAGIEIPYYCYHPALGNPGVCRLCMVEVEGMPKLQVSCRLRAKEGMVVRSNSGPARRAQASSLEFHLANHPLDCPVCDQAGECYLQDYYMRYGLYTSSVKEDKKHKQKRVDIGEHVMLDSERCILCTRCTRFLDDVTKTGELGIFNRGDRSELMPYPGKRVDNPYSGNVIDICPVGALTDKDFRFKVRVLYLDKTPSICTGCSRGCSIEVHTDTKRPWHMPGERVARLLPRHNPQVNGWWICDEGRYGFHFVDAKTRLKAVSVMTDGKQDGPSDGRAREREDNKTNKLGDGKPSGAEGAPHGGKLRRVGWKEATEKLAAQLSSLCDKKRSDGLAVILSGTLSNEDFYAARALFADQLKAGHILVRPGPDQLGEGDDLLRRKEKVPNLRGAQALGFGKRVRESSWDDIKKGITSGKIWGLYVVDRDPVAVWGKEIAKSLVDLPLTIHQGVNANHFTEVAKWVLPSCAYVEEDATFTSFEGVVQRAPAALPALGDARPDWAVWGDLLRALGAEFPHDCAQSVFKALCDREPDFQGMTWDNLGAIGRRLGSAAAKEAAPA